jgi:alpha-amylase
MLAHEFGVRPSVFRNTELLYSDEIGKAAAALGFSGVLAEGVDEVLGWRSPNFVYRVPDTEAKVLLRNHKLSDEIGFRFVSHEDGEERALTAKRYASWIHSLTGNADLVGLFLDYETFGEHLGKETGIFEFLNELPAAVLDHQDWRFSTAGEAAARIPGVSELSYPHLTSWADISRDDSTWRGNKMQNSSLGRTYDRSDLFRPHENTNESIRPLLETWRRLQTSDHYYYMSTKGGGDGVVHQYFNAFESPYDAFISFSNVMKDFTRRCREYQVTGQVKVGPRAQELSGHSRVRGT